MPTATMSYLDELLIELDVDQAGDTDLVIDQFDDWYNRDRLALSPTTMCYCETDSPWNS